MITINKLEIDSNLKNIQVEVTTTNVLARFTKVFIWSIDTFRDYELAIDVSDLLEQTSNSEDFVIPAERIDLPIFSGFFFVEFRTDEDPEPDDNGVVQNQMLGVTANLYKYKECFLNKTLMIDVKDCGKAVSECDDCTENIYLISALLKAVDIAVLDDLYEETVKLAKELDDLCDVCHSCPDYDDTKALNGVGLGYQIKNNEVFKTGDSNLF